MKNFKKIALAMFSYSILSFSTVFAAWIDHFEVKLNPETADVNEALDLSIKAVDKNNVVIDNYDWTILIFSESDPEAELPSKVKDNTYTYLSSDQWVIKFENAVKFKAAWIQNIHVYDLNDDTVSWIAEVTINEAKVIQNLDIEITSPENWLIIWEKKIWISWTTKKNHKVKIILNGKNEFDTTSNNDWSYEYELKDLLDWDNVIKAQVLDSDLNVVWESKEVNIKVDSDNLNIKNIKVTPESVEPENSFEVKIVTNPKLSNVEIILNDVITKLEETTDWIYSAKVYAPKEPGTYKIDVKIKDELGHEKTLLWSSSIIVKKLELAAAVDKEIKKSIIEKPINNSKKDLTIKWLKLVELKSKSILTWNPVEWAESYNIYKKSNNWNLELITNVKTTKFEVLFWKKEVKYDYFAVKAVSKTDNWEIYEWSLSNATKVKTGPEIIILFLLSLFIGWIILIIKQRKA